MKAFEAGLVQHYYVGSVRYKLLRTAQHGARHMTKEDPIRDFVSHQ